MERLPTMSCHRSDSLERKLWEEDQHAERLLGSILGPTPAGE